MTEPATERIETCSCGAPLIVREWTNEKGHRCRSTRCDAERMITTIDLELAVRVLG